MITQPITHQSGRTATEDQQIDCGQRASEAVKAATERAGAPRGGVTAALRMLMRYVVGMRGRGVSLVEARRIPFALAGLVDDVWSQITPDQEERILRLESECDRREDAITDARLIRDSHQLREEHAQAHEAAAAASLAAARVLRAINRREIADRDVTMNRLTAMER